MTDILQLLPDPLQRKLLSLLYYTGFLHLNFLLGGGGGGGGGGGYSFGFFSVVCRHLGDYKALVRCMHLSSVKSHFLCE